MDIASAFSKDFIAIKIARASNVGIFLSTLTKLDKKIFKNCKENLKEKYF